MVYLQFPQITLLINKAPNKGSEIKYFYKDWKQKEKDEFEKIINDLFPYYEEIKTNIQVTNKLTLLF